MESHLQPISPPTSPESHFSLCDTSTILEKLLYKIESRTPSSLIRLGDGEGFILDNGEHGTLASEVDSILTIWFGKNRSTKINAAELRTQLWTSISSADMIGIFTPESKKPSKFLRPFYILKDHHFIKDQIFCAADIHLDLQNQDLFSDLLKGREGIGLLTCRDVASDVHAKFGLKNIQWLPVPEEMHYASMVDPRVNHYPEWFSMLTNSLKPQYPGQIWLVGAGILGKFYCHLLKSRGAIAIDIGSVFDQWALFTKRGSVRNNRQGV